MRILKQHLKLVILFTGSVLYDVWIGYPFITILLLYGLVIKYFLSDSMSHIVRTSLTIATWSALLIVTLLLYYSNHHFPRGPLIYTGDVVCQNDGRGPCSEAVIEDTRQLEIPEWAKFFKQSEGELLWFGLIFASITIRYKNNQAENA